MKVRLVRPSLGFLLVGACLAPAGTAHANNPVHGRWAAVLPGFRESYYHFQPGIQQGNVVRGRFFHSYIDSFGRSHNHQGNYVLHHHGNRSVLHLHFDNGARFNDIAHSFGSYLQLHHLGTGNWVTFQRVG